MNKQGTIYNKLLECRILPEKNVTSGKFTLKLDIVGAISCRNLLLKA